MYFIVVSTSIINETGEMVFFLPTELNGVTYGHQILTRLGNRFNIKYVEIESNNKANNKLIVPSSEMMKRYFYFKPRKSTGKLKNQMIAYQTSSTLLEDIALVHRGISTGANDFFILDDKIISKYRIEEKFLNRIFPTKISLPQSVITIKNWESYRSEGKRCWLLSIPKTYELSDIPTQLKNYLREGVMNGIHLTPTSQKREPWYSVPIPQLGPPDIVFTYISRKQPRFIFNKVKAFNLTNLIGIYLRKDIIKIKNVNQRNQFIKLLNTSLSKWMANGHDSEGRPIGRRYSGGFIKFEPGDLRKLPIDSKEYNRTSLTA